jgi:disulfide bond formation protein DsbB
VVAPAAAWPRRIIGAVAPVALPLAAAVAVVATLGSLYYSEVADFPPCRLCWFQRIGMYPLALVLPIAAWRRDRQVRWYALPLAVGGGLVSTWHVLVERFPSLESGACDLANPCSIVWVERFGHLTIPAMALSGFVLVALLSVLPQETSP